LTNWEKVLEDDLKWREAELASLKLVAVTSTQNKILHDATLRASWAMLYAHFEGFTKFCWELLFDQIQAEQVEISALKGNFQILALEKPLKELKANLSSPSVWQFLTSGFPAFLSSQASFPVMCRLDTQSNLWPSVFETECQKVGVCADQIQKHNTRIKTLVSRRNDIAHGKTMTIKSVNEYTEYEQAALLVMHDLAIQVLEILDNKAYLI
jgi:MAE_28990/MAE_18760-like HEPN